MARIPYPDPSQEFTTLSVQLNLFRMLAHAGTKCSSKISGALDIPNGFVSSPAHWKRWGGIGLLIGIWVPWLAALASAGLTLVMLGAVLTQLRTREPLKKIVPAIVLGALASLVVVSYWPTFLPLVVRQ